MTKILQIALGTAVQPFSLYSATLMPMPLHARVCAPVHSGPEQSRARGAAVSSPPRLQSAARPKPRHPSRLPASAHLVPARKADNTRRHNTSRECCAPQVLRQKQHHTMCRQHDVPDGLTDLDFKLARRDAALQQPPKSSRFASTTFCPSAFRLNTMLRHMSGRARSTFQRLQARAVRCLRLHRPHQFQDESFFTHGWYI